MHKVKCTYCGRVYDITRVHVTARYADCSMYTTPCCGREVDDRRWVSKPAYKEIQPDIYVHSWESDGQVFTRLPCGGIRVDKRRR